MRIKEFTLEKLLSFADWILGLYLRPPKVRFVAKNKEDKEKARILQALYDYEQKKLER